MADVKTFAVRFTSTVLWIDICVHGWSTCGIVTPLPFMLLILATGFIKINGWNVEGKAHIFS